MMNSRTWVVATLAVAACWITASSAQAASGYVSGNLWHYQNQGNYCANDGRSCTGAQYLAAEFNSVVPVRNVEVYLRDQNDVVIGTGYTNTSGYFNFYWYRSSLPTSASIFYTLKHSGGRFQVVSPSGSTYILWTNGFSLTNGTTSGAPQYVGSWQWGSSGAPHQLTNVYDGAEKMWRNSLLYAFSALSGFANLSIRALSNSVPWSCSNSCARGDLNIVQLDANAAFAPQARVMHEMGHVASYISNPFQVVYGAQLFADYCYPSTGSGCPWNYASAEWRTASFEEGLASFFGDTAIYWNSSPEPYSCYATATWCQRTSANNMETSTGTSCATNETRWPVSANRYLRDMYDNVNDPGFGEAMSRPYYEFFDTLAQFPNGTTNHQDDEMWNSARTALDDRDGRSATDDFGYNFTALTGLVSTNQSAYNCSP